MLSTTLNTNEVKNPAGVEQEFVRWSSNGRQVIFAKAGESPAAEHRLSFNHMDTGGAGVKARRRSVFRVDIGSTSEVDLVTPITDSAYVVIDTAKGHHTTTTTLTNALANLISMLASDGSNTTIKFDCTGTAAIPLITGAQ